MTDSFRQIRRQLDLSQSQCAEYLGVSVATIQRIEKTDTPILYQLAIERLRDKRNNLIRTDSDE